MKIGKIIRQGHKCPNCRKFGLEPMSYDPRCLREFGEFKGFSRSRFNFLRCKNCFAEFEVIFDEGEF